MMQCSCQSSRPSPKKSEASDDVLRIRNLFATGKLVHPYLSASFFLDNHVVENDGPKEGTHKNFTDLSKAFALLCGADKANSCETGMALAREIGGQDLSRRHIVFILCDGMGNSTINQHCKADTSFLRRNNNELRLRAVFPSTTPAALTTLATAAWPGSGHGVPGWDLRDKRGCDFPSCPAEANGGGPAVQLKVLAENITDVRSGRNAADMGFSGEWEDIFVEEPWARHVTGTSLEPSERPRRRMIYINAYNGDEYQDWHQGKAKRQSDMTCDDDDIASKHKERKCSLDGGSDFSSWQMGRPRGPSLGEEISDLNEADEWFDAAKIQETSFNTLGTPEGSKDAIDFFRDGVCAALDAIASAESDNTASFTFLYSSHPDKHMHALGVEHDEVEKVVVGFDREIARMWDELGNRDKLLARIQTTKKMKSTERISSDDVEETKKTEQRIDCSLLVSADHGHVTVAEDEMTQLPDSIVQCLEYANVGVWGKGRHAYLHCRAGLQNLLRERWHKLSNGLTERFVLLSIEEAEGLHLFGPGPVKMEVRPRLGDFVAVAISNHTLVSPKEFGKYKKSQGAHGSLLPEEMCIPYVLCKPNE